MARRDHLDGSEIDESVLAEMVDHVRYARSAQDDDGAEPDDADFDPLRQRAQIISRGRLRRAERS